MTYLLLLLLLLLISPISQFLRVQALLYNVASFITIRGDSDSFGYSVLLQSNNYNDSVSVFVGSPGTQGALYRCNGDINKLSCSKYRFAATPADSFGHDLLGISLDGGDRLGETVITCAPRSVSRVKSYHLNGRCFVIKDGRVAHLRLPVNGEINQIRHQAGANFYDYAFAEAGLSLSYIKETQEVIIGAPGLTHWNGGVIRKNLIDDFDEILPLREFYSSKLKSAYFGYSVGHGRFRADGGIIYVVGVPRANNLQGEVVLFERNAAATNKITIHLRLQGTEMGSYFGASILVTDLDGDGLDDLLVGAPMAAGSSWDEGCVFLYKNLGEMRFDEPILLKGSPKAKSRFGTVITDLHYVTLTTTRFVAIAAPYETNDRGAVYIYGTRGSDLSPKLYQKIEAPTGAKGFGLGLSRGNDINDDRHNDIAVGAYKSRNVFVYQSFNFVELSANLSANVSFLRADSSSFSLTICIDYKRNNNKKITGNITYTLIMDYRSLRGRESINGSKPAQSNFCENIIVHLRDPGQDISPFKITLNYTMGKISKTGKLDIPYSEGCGEDKICITDFTLTPYIGGSDPVLGMNKTLVINLAITNDGETALQPVLLITSPENVALISPRSCEVNSDGHYECSLPKRFTHLTDFTESYSFDIGALRENTRSVPFTFKVESLGVESNNSLSVAEIRVPVISRSRLYVTGNSEASSTILSAESNSTIPFTHHVIVGNYGPSPYLLDLVIYVPQETVTGALMVQKSQAMINEEETVECVQSKSYFSMMDAENLNSSKSLVACGVVGIGCVEVACRGGYLQAGKTAKIEISIIATQLAHLQLDSNDDSVTVSSFAQINHENKTDSAIVSTTFYVLKKTTLPFWIFFITLGIGLIILSILIYILYKCGFFNRNYKKLTENNMKLIEESDEETNEQLEQEEDQLD